MGDVSPLLPHGAADREGIGRATLRTGVSTARPRLLDARDYCCCAGTVWRSWHRHDALPACARGSAGRDTTELGGRAEATEEQAAAGEAKTPRGRPPALGVLQRTPPPSPPRSPSGSRPPRAHPAAS